MFGPDKIHEILARLEEGLPPKRVAALCGVSEPFVRDVKKGKRKPADKENRQDFRKDSVDGRSSKLRDRNEAIRDMRSQGYSLEQVRLVFKISRERVRQILKRQFGQSGKIELCHGPPPDEKPPHEKYREIAGKWMTRSWNTVVSLSEEYKVSQLCINQCIDRHLADMGLTKKTYYEKRDKEMAEVYLNDDNLSYAAVGEIYGLSANGCYRRINDHLKRN